MAFWPSVEKDPFRLFFPVGALLAIAGVLPWAAELFTHAFYPRDFHRVLMIDGFLLSFVAGFLMTAITRFTGTHFATKWEIVGVLISILVANLATFFTMQTVSFLFSAIAVLQIALFAFRRFRKKTVNPPYTFIFIGLGLFFWLLSNLGLFFVTVGATIPETLTSIFDDLFSNGAVMSLVLGVGGRLLPGILGWEEIIVAQRQQYETQRSYLNVVPKDVWAAMILFAASFLLSPVLSLRWCLLLRGFVTLYFAVVYWRIHRFPKTRSYLTWSLWVCAWCLVAGYFLPVLWAAGTVHALHLNFVGGFSLITLLISMRVTFAHGEIGTGIEKTFPWIAVCAGLIFLAAITRVTAILWPTIYLDHLGYAAITWLLGLTAWMGIVWGKGKIVRL